MDIEENGTRSEDFPEIDWDQVLPEEEEKRMTGPHQEKSITQEEDPKMCSLGEDNKENENTNTPQLVPDLGKDCEVKGKAKMGKKERMRAKRKEEIKKRQEETKTDSSKTLKTNNTKEPTKNLTSTNINEPEQIKKIAEKEPNNIIEVLLSDNEETENNEIPMDVDSEDEIMEDPSNEGLYYKLIIVHSNFPRIKLDNHGLQQFKLNLIDLIEKITMEKEAVNPPLTREEWKKRKNLERRRKRRMEKEKKQGTNTDQDDEETAQTDGTDKNDKEATEEETKTDNVNTVNKSRFDNKKDEDKTGDTKIMHTKLKERGIVITCFNIPTREWLRQNIGRLGGRDDITGQILSFKVLEDADQLERKTIKTFFPVRRINEETLLDSIRRMNSGKYLDTKKWRIVNIIKANNGATGYTVIFSVDKESLNVLKYGNMKLWFGGDRLKIKEIGNGGAKQNKQ